MVMNWKGSARKGVLYISIVMALATRTKWNHEKHDSQGHSRDLNQVPLKHKTKILVIHKSVHRHTHTHILSVETTLPSR
jgi:hypothetical protein